MWKDQLGHRIVIVDNVAFGHAVGGKTDQVGELQRMAVYFHHHFGRFFRDQRCGAGLRLGIGRFPNRLLRLLVEAQSHEHGRAQLAVGCELKILHFANELRLHPGDLPQSSRRFR